MIRTILFIGLIAAFAQTEIISETIDRGHIDERAVTFQADVNMLTYSADMSLASLGWLQL